MREIVTCSYTRYRKILCSVKCELLCKFYITRHTFIIFYVHVRLCVRLCVCLACMCMRVCVQIADILCFSILWYTENSHSFPLLRSHLSIQDILALLQNSFPTVRVITDSSRLQSRKLNLHGISFFPRSYFLAPVPSALVLIYCVCATIHAIAGLYRQPNIKIYNIAWWTEVRC